MVHTTSNRASSVWWRVAVCGVAVMCLPAGTVAATPTPTTPHIVYTPIAPVVQRRTVTIIPVAPTTTVAVDTPPTLPASATGYAPAGLTGCNEMSWYRIEAGLPAVFDRLGARESRCTNTDRVRTSCCYGYWQLAIGLHLRTAATRDAYRVCGVTTFDDINSNTPHDKKASACATAVLYHRNGLAPWR